MPDTFGARLRQRREQRQIALSTIAETTKIKVALLEALERDDVSRWPAGIFGRAFLRAYARALDLDAEAVVNEFLELHPDPQFLDGHLPAAMTAPVLAAPERVMPDLAATAQLCTEIGCVRDIRAAAPLVERTAQLLGARGVIVWVWDPSIERLEAVVAHGYASHVVAHLPRVARDADNATAAAFRSGKPSIVKSRDGVGALAIPLMAPDVCVGVLAIEVPDGAEERDQVREVATIIAAQFARAIAAGFPAAAGLIGRISA